jgi:hypothetical protein
MGASMMNRTINTNRDSEMMISTDTGRQAHRTAKQFFSKNNQNHPSIEENKKL